MSSTPSVPKYKTLWQAKLANQNVLYNGIEEVVTRIKTNGNGVWTSEKVICKKVERGCKQYEKMGLQP